MGILRILILAALVWLAWRLLRNLLSAPSQPSTSDQSANPAPERMVKCTHCGVHLPEQQAIKQHQDYFCSSTHLIEHQEKNQDD